MSGNSFLGGNANININQNPKIFTFIAGENIGSERAIMVDLNNNAFIFDPTVQANYNKYIGISINSALIGELIQVALYSYVSVSFPVIVGSTYFASELGNGTFTETAPSTGLYQEIAIGSDNNKLFIVKGQVIKI